MRYVKSIFLLIFCIAVIVSCEKEVQEQGKVIARIGDQELTLEDIESIAPEHQDENMTHEQIQNYIQRWIDNELIYQEALRLDLDKSKQLEVVLKNAEKEYLVNRLLDSLMSSEISIPEQEAINYYEMNKENFTRAKVEIKVLHILVSGWGEANDARRRINRGEDFEEVAREVSLDYQRKGRIELGYFSEDDVVPEIASSLFRYREGSVTRPIKSEFGYHIFKVLEKKQPNSVKDYDEVHDEIIERLIAKRKEDIYKDFITSLKSKVEVQTNFDYLNELVKDTISATSSAQQDSISNGSSE